MIGLLFRTKMEKLELFFFNFRKRKNRKLLLFEIQNKSHPLIYFKDIWLQTEINVFYLSPLILTIYLYTMYYLRKKITYLSHNYHKVVKKKRLSYATNGTSTSKIPHDLIEILHHTTVCISSNSVFFL